MIGLTAFLWKAGVTNSSFWFIIVREIAWKAFIVVGMLVRILGDILRYYQIASPGGRRETLPRASYYLSSPRKFPSNLMRMHTVILYRNNPK